MQQRTCDDTKMGLITAAINAVTRTLESQWKAHFYCDAMRESVLATKVMKKAKGVFGFKVEDENVILQGSVVAVADGQCMMIVDQGKIVDFCAEPGEYIFDTNAQPTLLYGEFNTEKLKGLLTESSVKDSEEEERMTGRCSALQ